MKDIRNKVRAFILAITGLLVTLLVVRVILLFVGANQSHPLVSLVLGLTDLFVQPLFYVAPGEIIAGVDLNSVLAIVIYAVLGILISEFVTAFLQDSAWEIFIQIQDAFFKVVEFILMVRIVLKIFGITSSAGPFVGQVYSLTEWSQGIIPSPNFLSGYLELSTIIVLIVVVAIDLAMESVIKSISQKLAEKRQNSQQRETKPAAQTVVVNAAPAAPAVTPVQQPQNITINVPLPPQQPAAPEKQVINVISPQAHSLPSRAPVQAGALHDAEQLPSREG